jgi:hypothetical protein
VSREVADLVLLDDNFATIVGAVEEGRGIYENIQKFLRFLFSTNLSEVLLVGGGAILAFALGVRESTGDVLLPLTAAQILWINLVTDGLPALALAFDRTPGTMRQPPRSSDSPLLDRPSVRFIVGVGTAKALIALALLGLLPQLGYGIDNTRATAFHFMAVGQLLLTYPSRHTRISPLPVAPEQLLAEMRFLGASERRICLCEVLSYDLVRPIHVGHGKRRIIPIVAPSCLEHALAVARHAHRGSPAVLERAEGLASVPIGRLRGEVAAKLVDRRLEVSQRASEPCPFELRRSRLEHLTARRTQAPSQRPRDRHLAGCEHPLLIALHRV